MSLPVEGVMLAKKFEPRKHDVTGWWMSEKLDGVRAFWDGENFLSRTGKVFHAPKWFKHNLPTDRALDGELYLGRGRFQETISIVRSHNKDKEWKDIMFAAFDAPDHEFCFETRQSFLRRYMEQYPWGYVVPQTKVINREQMYEYYNTIRQGGGEGLILRAPRSMYIYKRSPMCLKIKGIIDGIAHVYAMQEGTGKYEGMMGALKCIMLPDDYKPGDKMTGHTFKVGTGFSDEERGRSDWINKVIRWEAHELTKAGVPRHSRFVTEWEGD
jgi:DNA ligase-1